MFTSSVGQAVLLVAAARGFLGKGPAVADQDTKQEPPIASAQGTRTNPSYFNPQMAIVGNFMAPLQDNSGAKRHADFKEIEFGFAADADPFLKVQAFLSLSKNRNGDSVFEAEEAFGQYSRLGRGLSAKFGKIAAAIGRVQRNHTDQLDYTSFPLVIQDTLGEEGFRKPGASLSYLLPGNRFNEFTVEVLDAEDDMPLFNNSSLSTPVYVGHFRSFIDFSEDMSGQFGLSYASGPSTGASGQGDLMGLDYTMKWHPGQKGKSANLEAEAYWSKPGGFSKRTVGAFARLSYEIKPLWFVTAGVDYSELPGTTDLHRGLLAGLTYKLTEFELWRLEFQRVSGNFQADHNVLNLQFQWLIGTHPAHKY
jgi:hypothetical protein